ncbi:thiamine pyrophosphate-dependent dehydrogenase E1 component subunit alpha [Chloroflexota bacterium]
MYSTMVKIRRFEERVVELYPEQEIRCPVHLCIGEEATATGVCANLKEEDYVFSTHRCHGHYIAKGGDLKALMAELYGKRTGCSKGKGGSMHLVAPEVGILGTSSIVGGNTPLAVGAALAATMQGTGRVAVAFLGDGGVDEGSFQESLNFASLKRLPVLFICENNFYAVNSPQRTRQSADNIPQRAESYMMPGVRVDGNDVIAVFKAARDAVERARKGKGPTLIECRTYRWMAHVGPNYDFESGARPKEELDEWMEKCPIKRYEEFLLNQNIISASEMMQITNEVDKEIEETVISGKDSPFPHENELLDDVFSEG